MVGYAVTSTFHQGFYAALKEAKLSAERRELVEMRCAAARFLAQQYKQNINCLFERKLAQIDTEPAGHGILRRRRYQRPDLSEYASLRVERR